jgi:PKD repeat protein
VDTRLGKILALLTAIALLAACGGGGGHGDGVTPPVNSPPVALFTATPEGSTFPLTVLFDASASRDSDGSIASYSWNFGDGTATSSGVEIRHVYEASGTFTATLTVTDNLGATATHSVQFTQLPIQVDVGVGSAEGLVGDSVSVVAWVLSTSEVREVIATLAGRQTALTLEPESGGTFRGTLSLAGEPYGSYTLSVRATDVHGNVADDSMVVVHDNPPALTVLKPVDQSVTLGTLPVDIRCTDDLPDCTVEVVNMTRIDSPTLLARAPASLATAVDLTEWTGTSVWLALRARDSAGQAGGRDIRVYVESPARLAIAAEVPGTILDADATRLLFRESSATGDHLAIYDRVTRLTEAIPWPSGREAHDYDDLSYSYLTPSGALFLAATKDEYPTERLHVWRQGASTEIPESSMFWSSTLYVSGDYAIWSGGTNNADDNLYRVNTATGVVTLVSSDAGTGHVATDGTVAFSTRSTHQIVRDRDGQQTVLTNDPSYWDMGPLIDGDQILYLRTEPPGEYQRFSIVLIEGTNLIPLTYSRTMPPRPMDDYQLYGGWAAYTELGAQYQTQVFTRSPQGAVIRHTDLFTSSRIDRLGGAGEVMIINGQKRYFSRGLGLVEVSSTAGKAYWLNGAWYVAIGATLLAVDTSN